MEYFLTLPFYTKKYKMLKTTFILILSLLFVNTVLAQYNWDMDINEIDSSQIEVIVKCQFKDEAPLLAYSLNADSLGFPTVIGYGAKGFTKYPIHWEEMTPNTKSYIGKFPVYNDSLALKIIFNISPNEKVFGFDISFNGLGVANEKLYKIVKADACFYYHYDKTTSEKKTHISNSIMACKEKITPKK